MPPATSHYELLGVAPTAGPEEIKRAFRREIARYHPDKVQHLGPEFQEIAATRSASLTRAYQTLIDLAARAAYDDELARGGPAPAPAENGSPAGESARAPAETPSEAARPEAAGREPFQRERQSRDEFVRKAALARLREAIENMAEYEPLAMRGFDFGYLRKARRALLKKGEPALRLLGRFVGRVDAEAVIETWPLAARAGAGSPGDVCVLLLGSEVATAADLADAVAQQYRWSPTGSDRTVVIVPLDVRDWRALVPPDTPAPARAILARLRSGS